jgi:ribosome-associated protein
MRDVLINHEPVELYKILKFEGLVASGGAAKSAIDDREVTVNGTTETRRRRKILAGDTISFNGESLRVSLA